MADKEIVVSVVIPPLVHCLFNETIPLMDMLHDAEKVMIAFTCRAGWAAIMVDTEIDEPLVKRVPGITRSYLRTMSHRF